MYILGINTGEYNSSACILRNGQIKFAIQEERLNREKFTKKFPYKSIQKCLENQNIKFSDIDYVSFGWNPSNHMSRFNPLISSHRSYREHNFYTLSDNLFNLAKREHGSHTQIIHDNPSFPRVYHINHHQCHAANAFYMSNFKSAAILTCDFRGEHESTTFNIGNDVKIYKLAEQNLPNSLGKFYATFTELLGYKSDSDEWKVMAMSAYPYICKDEIKKIKKCYSLGQNGKLELTSKYFEFSNFGNKNHFYTEELKDLFGIKKVFYQKKPSIKQIKIAKALQICAEEIGFHFLDHLYYLTKQKNLVVGGGFFLNTVFNGKITKKTNFKKVYIPYAPSDTGNSIGSALYLNNSILENKRVKINNSPFVGSEFTYKEIEIAIKKRKISFKKITNFHKFVAKQCMSNLVVGYFNGKLEFGDRSLGNRSIIANPLNKDIKNAINKSVKYRESYRPFAPSIKVDDLDKYFDAEGNKENNYMERVFKVKKRYRKNLPGITHLDNSARVQTVNKDMNIDFYKILDEFEKLSGFPILLNTSFNINGEPIVCTPDDALNTFYNSGIDVLILGRFAIFK
mgnify:CR=1 FL=1|jgi:carbamoyltransferase